MKNTRAWSRRNSFRIKLHPSEQSVLVIASNHETPEGLLSLFSGNVRNECFYHCGVFYWSCKVALLPGLVEWRRRSITRDSFSARQGFLGDKGCIEYSKFMAKENLGMDADLECGSFRFLVSRLARLESGKHIVKRALQQSISHIACLLCKLH